METDKKQVEFSVTRILGLLCLLVCIYALLSLFITTPDSDPYMSGALLVVFGIPALIYCIVSGIGMAQGGSKYLFFRNKKIVVKPIEQKVEVDQSELERLAIRETELKRTTKELYSTKRIKNRWSIMPLLMGLGGAIYVIVVYVSNDSTYTMDGLNTSVLIITALGLITMWGLNIESNWDTILKEKMSIYRENPEYKFYTDYDYELAYMDDKSTYVAFRVAKVLAYILGLAGIAILAGIIISIISGISLSPTTIIIFLLVLIYFEVKKRNEI